MSRLKCKVIHFRIIYLLVVIYYIIFIILLIIFLLLLFIELKVRFESKTKDNVFVNLAISTQYQVIREKVTILLFNHVKINRYY